MEFTSDVELLGSRNPIAEIRSCGCWIVYLAQGPAVVVCAEHQTRVMEVVKPVPSAGADGANGDAGQGQGTTRWAGDPKDIDTGVIRGDAHECYEGWRRYQVLGLCEEIDRLRALVGPSADGPTLRVQSTDAGADTGTEPLPESFLNAVEAYGEWRKALHENWRVAPEGDDVTHALEFADGIIKVLMRDIAAPQHEDLGTEVLARCTCKRLHVTNCSVHGTPTSAATHQIDDEEAGADPDEGTVEPSGIDAPSSGRHATDACEYGYVGAEKDGCACLGCRDGGSGAEVGVS